MRCPPSGCRTPTTDGRPARNSLPGRRGSLPLHSDLLPHPLVGVGSCTDPAGLGWVGTCPARGTGGTRGRGERRWACDNRMAGTQPRAPTRRVHLHVGIGPTACGRNATPHTIERNPPSAFKAACGLSAVNVGADLCVRPLGGASAVAATTNELSMVSPHFVSPHFARSEWRGWLPRLPAEGWR